MGTFFIYVQVYIYIYIYALLKFSQIESDEKIENDIKWPLYNFYFILAF